MEAIKQLESVRCNNSATRLRVRACKTNGRPLRQVPWTRRTETVCLDRPKTCSFTFSSKFCKCKKRRLQPRRTKSNQSKEANRLSSKIWSRSVRSERRQITFKFMPVVTINAATKMDTFSRWKDERLMRTFQLRQLKQMALSLSHLSTLPCLPQSH